MRDEALEGGMVSCRNLAWVLDAAAERGVGPERLLPGVGYSEAHLREASQFIEWTSLATLCENFGRCFDDATCVEFGKQSVAHPIFEVFRIPAKLLFDAEDPFHFLLGANRGLMPRTYPVLETSVVRLEEGRLQLELEMKEPWEPIPVFQLWLLGQLIAAPGVLGLEHAAVEMTTHDRGARYSVVCPTGRGLGLLAPLRKALAFPFTARKAARELLATNELLEQKYRDLRIEMTRRGEAEATLADSEARFRLLAEQVRDVIWTADLELRYSYVSPAVVDVLGRTARETIALRPGEGVVPASFELMAKTLSDELAADTYSDPNRSRTLELEMIRKDGSTRWVETNVSFLRDESGRPIGLIGVTRDIAARRATEDQLRQAQKVESLGQLAGGIAHDFNNLLVAIQGFTELSLDHADLPEAVQAHLWEIQRATDRAGELTGQLLAFGRRQSLRAVPVDFGRLVGDLRPMLERLIPENVRQEFDLARGAIVSADRGQLEQVVVNLAVNARDAMPDGGELIFEVRKVAAEADELLDQPAARPVPYARLRIADSGIGMTAEVKSKIFDPFYTTKGTGKGTGLGLSVALGIVGQHSGFVSVSSEPGEGAELLVYLPLAEHEAPLVAREETAPVRGGNETILVVEDEPTVRHLATQILERAGYRVLCASDGEAGVEVFSQHASEIDLVLLDVVMPNMTGRVARDRIREIAPQVPCLFVSGYVGDETHTDFITDPALLVSKPYSTPVILSRIRALLDDTSAGG